MATFGNNWVTNPSFETGTTSWTFTNCTGAQDFTMHVLGAGSYGCKLTSNAAAPMSASITVGGLTIGTRYVASMYVYVQPTGTTPFSLQLVAAGIAGTNSAGLLNGWTRIWSAFTATATSHSFQIISTTNNVSGDLAWIDLACVSEGKVLGPYFDGGYPFCAWTGTAHASASINYPIKNMGTDPTTPEIVVAGWLNDPQTNLPNGICLNTFAYSGTTKTGRYTMATARGTHIQTPAQRGATFQANRPLDTQFWSLSMFLLGCNPDGTIPQFGAQRILFEKNLANIMATTASLSQAITLAAWQPDGSVKTTTATLIGANSVADLSLGMGGRRAEFSLAFEVLPGVWYDGVSTTISGAASASWSNQNLVLNALDGGTAPIEDAVISVTGPVTNPRITDPITNTWVQYTGTVAAGQTWVVDTKNYTSKVAGSSVLSNTTHYGYPKFLLIDPGLGTSAPYVVMTGSATSTATNLSITASRQHLYA